MPISHPSTRLDYPVSYRAHSFNSYRTAAGGINQAAQNENYRLERFDFGRLQIRDQREALHLMSGGDLGVATNVFRFVSLVGEVKAGNGATLEDMTSLFLRVFDVEDAQTASPLTEGVSAIDFYTPTNSAPVGYTSPVRELLLGRPGTPPQVFDRRSGGLARTFAAEMVCPDHRRYTYDPTVVTLNSGNGFFANCPQWDVNLGIMTFGVIQLNLSGAGHASCTLRSNPPVGSNIDLVLDLSGLGGGNHTISVDMLNKVIVDGTIDPLTRAITGSHRADLRTSDPDTFWGIPRGYPPVAGGTAFRIVNTTNLDSATLTYRPARR